ncbi:hypothetical protein HPT25_14315 [Bacillus sp. BRMEA1]|uniref:hypothetical protein n=1 Tax=Neobacillus endophyticus TaxID=2738405 RepID=UPI0015676A41|nr:hypothetical protein [Neobacillus endophyticus]NRD78536.1 hypothetical protein [Neobacillus endophyticus]
MEIQDNYNHIYNINYYLRRQFEENFEELKNFQKSVLRNFASKDFLTHVTLEIDSFIDIEKKLEKFTKLINDYFGIKDFKYIAFVNLPSYPTDWACISLVTDINFEMLKFNIDEIDDKYIYSTYNPSTQLTEIQVKQDLYLEDLWGLYCGIDFDPIDYILRSYSSNFIQSQNNLPMHNEINALVYSNIKI